MLRYITMFVLVMTMVKTNAQNNPWGAIERDDIMLVRIANHATPGDVADLKEMIDNDADFSTYSSGASGYFVLVKDPNSGVTKQDAIDRYMNESPVAYASFVYTKAEPDFFGIADDIMVKLAPGHSASDIEDVAGPEGLTDMDFVFPQLNIYHLFFDKTGNTIERVASLVNSGIFEFVEPNYYVETNLHTNYGYATQSHNDCDATNNTLDGSMVSRSQWGLYTDQASDFDLNYMRHTFNVNGSPVTITGDEWTDINVCNAWKFTQGSRSASNPDAVTGSGILVAVIDDGVDANHFDINVAMSGGIAVGYDAIPRNHPLNAHPGAPDLYGSHGTACAGIIAARHNNTNQPSGPPYYYNTYDGVVGVAYDAQIVPVRITWIDTTMHWDSVAQVWRVAAHPTITSIGAARGIMWAADTANVDILSCSWGGGNNAPGALLIENAIDYAIAFGRGGKGTVIAFSAGNQNCDSVQFPGSHPDVICVGAMSMCNQRKSGGAAIAFPPNANPPGYCAGSISSTSCDGESAWGSNYGYGRSSVYVDNSANPPVTYTHNTSGKLSVVAPGVKIRTTAPNNGYNNIFNGTSSATPFVAGVAALMLSVNPCLTASEVKDVIEISADKITVQQNIYGNGKYSFTIDPNNDLKSWNNEVGHGKVNAANAVSLSYDLYLQRKVETGAETYHASHYIFAGETVSSLKLPLGFVITPSYAIQSGADVKFYVQNGQSIILDHGFTAAYGSHFLADPDVAIPCDNDHGHYKPGKKTNPENNTPGKQPILSSSDNLLHGIKVYPNPAKEAINIEFMLEEDADVSFTLLNLLGQKMKETGTTGFAKGTQRQQVSLDGLAPGVYFVGVKTPAGYSQFRFIKE